MLKHDRMKITQKKYSAKKARDFKNYKKKPAKYMIKYSLPLRYDINT